MRQDGIRWSYQSHFEVSDTIAWVTNVVLRYV